MRNVGCVYRDLWGRVCRHTLVARTNKRKPARTQTHSAPRVEAEQELPLFLRTSTLGSQMKPRAGSARCAVNCVVCRSGGEGRERISVLGVGYPYLDRAAYHQGFQTVVVQHNSFFSGLARFAPSAPR